MDFTVRKLTEKEIEIETTPNIQPYYRATCTIVGKKVSFIMTKSCSIHELVDMYKEELLKYDESEVSQTAKQI